MFIFRTQVYAAISSMDYLDKAKLQVKSTIWIVERTIQNIERVNADTKEDTILTVTNRWWEQMDNYRDYVNLLLQSMRVSNNSNRFITQAEQQITITYQKSK